MRPDDYFFCGTVKIFNSTDKTAKVLTFDNDILNSVVCPVVYHDPKTGAFSMTPPCTGSLCFGAVHKGHAYILQIFTPPNLSPSDAASCANLSDSHINRSTSTALSKELVPGQTYSVNAYGGSETFSSTVKKIDMVPGKLSTTWNIMNNCWDTVCTQYNLRSSAMDVKSEANDSNDTNTTLTFKKATGEAPGCVTIDVGADAGVLNIKIAGKDFLHVDEDRNVTLTIKDMNIISSGNINISANEVNCLNVGKVKLP